MATIRVRYKGKPATSQDRVFEDRGRPGGSYSQKLSTEGSFAVITDCYGKKTYIPAADIEEITVDGETGRW